MFTDVSNLNFEILAFEFLFCHWILSACHRRCDLTFYYVSVWSLLLSRRFTAGLWLFVVVCGWSFSFLPVMRTIRFILHSQFIFRRFPTLKDVSKRLGCGLDAIFIFKIAWTTLVWLKIRRYCGGCAPTRQPHLSRNSSPLPMKAAKTYTWQITHINITPHRSLLLIPHCIPLSHCSSQKQIPSPISHTYYQKPSMSQWSPCICPAAPSCIFNQRG